MKKTGGMLVARTVGIGIQDFGKIIESNCFYTDKTAFIKEWWESGDDVTLITRPRRFGKTLNMSMLEHFFSLKYKGRGDLFEGLSIWQNEKYRELQGAYPVIFLSFAAVKETNYTDAKKKIFRIFTDLYADNSFLLEGDALNERDKEFFNRISVNMDEVDATIAIRHLSKCLSTYYDRKPIILLDEYDTPMQEAYMGGYWDEMVAFVRNLFNSTFKTNPYLGRAVMTGITRVSKESVFSDLNNLKVVTTTSDEYATAFGFTEEETFAALDECGLGDEKEKVKQWYDGFVFGSHSDIYNPWSILNFLDTGKLGAYWANTSSNGLVGKLIREGEPEVKVVMEDLLNGGTFHTMIDEQIVFNQLDHRTNAIWSLLLASGYLRVENFSFNERRGKTECDLKLTNGEVTAMFEQMIEDWFSGYTSNYNAFIKALLLGDVDAMNNYMNRVALETFGFFDTGAKRKRTEWQEAPGSEPERFYHGFVLGLIVELSGEYTVTSNRESGFGRYDVVIEPKDRERDAFILEFKVFNPKREASLEETVEAALRQIEDKKYEADLAARGFGKGRIKKYGFAFEGKKVLIG